MVLNIAKDVMANADKNIRYLASLADKELRFLVVGKLIQQAAGVNNLKRVTLELGGKSPLVVMDDADLNTAVQIAGSGIFSLQGQICTAASRLYVHSKIYDKFIEAAIQYAKNIKIGDPREPTTQHGLQVDANMMSKVQGYIEKGEQEGAKLVYGGKRIGSKGFYVEPTIFVDVKDDMAIAKDQVDTNQLFGNI